MAKKKSIELSPSKELCLLCKHRRDVIYVNDLASYCGDPENPEGFCGGFEPAHNNA